MSDDAASYRTFRVVERNVDYYDQGEGLGSFSERKDEPENSIVAWMLSSASELSDPYGAAKKPTF